MLLNGQITELRKYSKVNYVAERFIQKAKEVWEYTDLQIRSLYLISDLAKKGNGVFSVAYSSFQKMFQQRFEAEISISSVRRFFALMEKLDLLSIHVAKRKNNQQSANIYIVEQLSGTQDPVKKSIETNNEQGSEHPCEQQNIISLQEIKNNEQQPLTTTSVNNTSHINTAIHEVYEQFAGKGITKSTFLKVLEEAKRMPNIRNFKAYLIGALNNILRHMSYREGDITVDSTQQEFYNWLNHIVEEKSLQCTEIFKYDWLSEEEK